MRIKSISISIIIPMYNVEKYIKECIDSILQQIEDGDEVIIIDDGSTDSSYKVCYSRVAKEKKVTLFRQNNRGQGAARNFGLRMAKGDYILFVDADDKLKTNALYELRYMLVSTPVDMLFFCADVLTECVSSFKENKYDRHTAVMNKVISGKEMFSALYPKSYTDCVYLAIDRRAFLERRDIKFLEGIWHEDSPFTFRAMMQAEKVLCVPQSYYIRRIRENSVMTSGWSYKRWFGLLCGSIDIWSYIIHDAKEMLQQQPLADRIALYIFSLFNSIISSKNLNFISISDYSYEKIGDAFFPLWNLYYKNEIDSFIKWKCSLRLIRSLEEISMPKLNSEMKEMLCEYDTIVEKYQYYVNKKLRRLPFGCKGLRVGIYGVGKHTKELIKEYKELIGKILCEYCFVDSYVDKQDTIYLDRPLINIKDVQGRIDVIIISSFVYLEEMNRKIDEILGEAFPRINLYENDDIVSCFG